MRSAVRARSLRGFSVSDLTGAAPFHHGRRVSPATALGSCLHTKSRDCGAESIGTADKLPAAEPICSVTPTRRRVAVAEVTERRAKAGRLVASAAAHSDSDMFKGPTVGRPKAKRMDHHLTRESTLRTPCKLKQAAKHLKKPGLISLGGGLPCPENFPISSLSLHVPVPPHFSEAATLAGGEDVHIGKYDASSSRPSSPIIPSSLSISPPPSPPTTTITTTTAAAAAAATKEGTTSATATAGPSGQPRGSEYDLSIALNYGQATGSAQMLRFVTEHTELVGAAPPYADWRCCLTVGSTGALELALRMLCGGEGDDAPLLTEAYSFSTALETAAPMGIGVVGVPMDREGLVPGEMERILREWDRTRGGRRRSRRRPHVLYTVPSGQNPTGATQSERRRREIYEVAKRWDVFIIEDEPYYYLQMPPPTVGQGAGTGDKEKGLEEWLDSLIPTYTSMDVDGRVLRMDSFSKVVVPGSRMGWITASEQIVERFIRHAEVANQGPSGFSQVILHKLLDERWGHEGYLRWLMHLSREYTRRRDVMVAACEEFLPKELVSWDPPAAGMFHWLRVHHELHPHASSKSILEIEEEIFNNCIAKGVLVARGSWFRAEQDKPPSGLFFRATFAAATPENMTEAIRRLGEAIRESFKMQ
ncbi:hypothetical protein VTK26DRAFT_7651 [Humicola hyalothermophila]